jgi:sugar phosphate isomerase/epimerase
MKLILFSKMLKEKSVAELAELAVSLRFDGFDLCVRPGYAVSPENAATALPEAAALLRRQGLDVPMVTGNFDLLAPDHPTARPLLAAMDKADVRLLKLGYFTFKPPALDYLAEVDRVRRIFDAWQPLARQYGVKICYHTHSDRCMGLNAGSLMHLLAGFDPACLGAYLDPGHMVVEGEAFDTALAMVRSHLAIVAVNAKRWGQTCLGELIGRRAKSKCAGEDRFDPITPVSSPRSPSTFRPRGRSRFATTAGTRTSRAGSAPKLRTPRLRRPSSPSSRMTTPRTVRSAGNAGRH